MTERSDIHKYTIFNFQYSIVQGIALLYFTPQDMLSKYLTHFIGGEVQEGYILSD